MFNFIKKFQDTNFKDGIDAEDVHIIHNSGKKLKNTEVKYKNK